jgi:uncharacterized protein
MKKLIFSLTILFAVLFFNSNSPAKVSGVTTEIVKIQMSDGVSLVTNLYYLDKTKKLPAILIRSPYDRNQYKMLAELLAENEYIVISQDARGSGESEGIFIPFMNEIKDGVETLNWIKAQEWFNGQTGMWGASYPGYCAAALASVTGGSIGSVFSISAGTNLKKSIIPAGVNHLLMNITWLHFSSQLSKSKSNPEVASLKPLELMNSIPLSEGFSKISDIESLLGFLKALDELEKLPVPKNTAFLHVTGWYDYFNVMSFDLYDKLKNEPVKANRLMVGPWMHDQVYRESSVVGDEDFGSEAVMGFQKINQIALQWFDYSLKGLQNELSKESDVRLFTMGINKWESFDNFPPVNSVQKNFFLSGNGNANSKNGDGLLTQNIPKEDNHDSYIFNPMDPVETYGGANFHFYKELNGIRDQSKIQERNDVLVYSTKALTDKLQITGKINVELFVSTEGADTDFTAKLVERRADGYSAIISEGIVRLSTYTGLGKIEAEQVYNIVIDLGYTSYVLPAGSKLVLEVSSSNFPKYDRNPNTGEDPLFATEFKSVIQKIFSGKNYPSKVVVDVIE